MIDNNLVKPHFKSVIFAAYISLLERDYPDVNIKKLVEEAGLNIDYIKNEDSWVSILFDNKLMNLMTLSTGDIDLHYKAGAEGVTSNGLGTALYFLAKHIVPLTKIYTTLPKFMAMLNKLMDIEVIEVENGKLQYFFRPNFLGLNEYESELLVETIPMILENTRGYLTALPTVKNLPKASVGWTQIKNDGNLYYVMNVTYPHNLGNMTKLGYLAPVVIGAISYFASGIITSFDPIIFSFAATFLSAIVLLIKKTVDYRNLALQTESGLIKLDKNFRDLYIAQTQLKRKLNESEAVYNLVSVLIDAETEEDVLGNGCKALVENLEYDRAFIIMADEKKKYLALSAAFGISEEFKEVLSKLRLPTQFDDDDPRKFSNIYRMKKTLLVESVENHLKVLDDSFSQNVLKLSGTTSFVAVPVATNNSTFGILVADCISRKKQMNQEDLRIITLAGQQIAIALEKQRGKQLLVESYENEVKLSESYSRFVPWETLKSLNYNNVFDVKLGDGVEKHLSVLFTDIRDFTGLAETMTSGEVLKFLNSYYARLTPIVRKHGGYVDKYIGDALMAIFPDINMSIHAAIEIHRTLVSYNISNRVGSRVPIRAGVGICTGPVIFGPLGSEKRLEITAISDTVNTASRLDGLCKQYNANILIAGDLDSVDAPGGLSGVDHGPILVKGKAAQVRVIEVIDPDISCLVVDGPKTHQQESYIEGIKKVINMKLAKVNNSRDLRSILSRKIAS